MTSHSTTRHQLTMPLPVLSRLTSPRSRNKSEVYDYNPYLDTSLDLPDDASSIIGSPKPVSNGGRPWTSGGGPSLGKGGLTLDHLMPTPTGSHPQLVVQSSTPPNTSDVDLPSGSSRARASTSSAALGDPIQLRRDSLVSPDSRSSSRRGSTSSEHPPPVPPLPKSSTTANLMLKGNGNGNVSPPRSVKRMRSSTTANIANALISTGTALPALPAADVRSNPSSVAGDLSDDHMSIDGLGNFDNAGMLGTGYAVASSKRNTNFHLLFKNIPEDDYLIEDYGCALQREILIQGRLYISEQHLCFYANIFGWVTNLVIPLSEVVTIEKRMTAFVIPNAILIATLHARHTFASFLSRDTTHDLIVNIWRIIHPSVPAAAALPDANDDEDDVISIGTPEEEDQKNTKGKKGKKRSKKGLSAIDTATPIATSSPGSPLLSGQPHLPQVHVVHPVTECACKAHLKETAMDATFPSTPEKIYNLMFTSGFMKGFWTNNQKLQDLQISDWAPEKSGSHLLARSMSYIKPLGGGFGPKQTKCLLVDENVHVEFDEYVSVMTTTRTPDVPSGSAFSVKTQSCFMWSKHNGCRVLVTTSVEWTKGSLLKGIIERSCIEGQKGYHVELEKEMRAYIAEHRGEFQQEGDEEETSLAEEVETTFTEKGGGDISAEGVSPTGTTATPATTGGAAASATPLSLASVMEFVSALTEPWADFLGGVSLTNAAVALVILLLVISNFWTLTSLRTPNARPYLPPQTASGSPDQVAIAVRAVLEEWFAANAPGPVKGEPRRRGDVKEEIGDIVRILDELEGRIKEIRRQVGQVDDGVD